MYTLILITALFPGNSYGGGNISSHSVPGFTTKQACINAGNSISVPSGGYSNNTARIIFSCVKMDV